MLTRLGNVIKFDAYGNGRPPEFTGYYDSTNQILYVYSSGGNPVMSFGSVTPIIL